MVEIIKFRANSDFKVELNIGEIGRKNGRLYLYLTNSMIDSRVENQSQFFTFYYDNDEKMLRFKSESGEELGIFYGEELDFRVINEEGIEREND